MRWLCVVILTLTLCGAAYAGQRDRWKNFRHLDCHDLAISIEKMKTHLIFLAWSEASPAEYQKYKETLDKLRRVQKGICWQV